MLQIRPEQVRILIANKRQRFLELLEAYSAAQWPEQAAQLEANLRPFLQATVDRAISYGIRTESAVARFVNLCFIWGPEFEKRPEHAWAARIVKDSSLDGDRKIEELAHHTRHKLKVRELNRRTNG